MFHIYAIQYSRFLVVCNCLFPQKDGEILYRFTKKEWLYQRKLYEIMFHIIVKHKADEKETPEYAAYQDVQHRDMRIFGVSFSSASYLDGIMISRFPVQ